MSIGLVIFCIIIVLILIYLCYFSVIYKEDTKEKENFTIGNFKEILNCESVYPDGVKLQDIGKNYENGETNIYFDPYIEISPNVFQKILDSFVRHRKVPYRDYESLQKLFNEWFASYIKKENDPLLLDRKDIETLKFYFSAELCKQFRDSTTNENEEYDLRCVMYRKERSFGFIVSWYIKEQSIVQASVNSIVNEDRIAALNYQYSPSVKSYSEIDSLEESSKPGLEMNENKNSSILSENNIPFLSSTKEGSDDSNFQGYSCYFQDSQKRKYHCESEFDLFGARKQSGAWDRPCQTNTDCPYYRKNLNYPNERGGCIQGRCEMPVNTPNLGPTYVNSDKNDAYCFNCDPSDHEYKCCKEQKEKSRTSYRLMASPDYAFVNDYLERRKNQEILIERNLKV